MNTLNWLIGGGAGAELLAWVAAQPNQSPASLVAACPRAEWLVWAASALGCPGENLRAAVRPSVLRALRERAPVALGRAGSRRHAARLRALPDDADLATCGAIAARAASAAHAKWAKEPAKAAEAWAAARAAERAAEMARMASGGSWEAWAAWAASTEVAERARCADEVRAALPDLAERWTAALAAA